MCYKPGHFICSNNLSLLTIELQDFGIRLIQSQLTGKIKEFNRYQHISVAYFLDGWQYQY